VDGRPPVSLLSLPGSIITVAGQPRSGGKSSGRTDRKICRRAVEATVAAAPIANAVKAAEGESLSCPP